MKVNETPLKELRVYGEVRRDFSTVREWMGGVKLIYT